MYLPRRVYLFSSACMEGKIFEFKTLKEEMEKKEQGWVENRSDLKKETPSKKIEVSELKPEKEEKPDFACDLCDFVGKSAISLRFHRANKHKRK